MNRAEAAGWRFGQRHPDLALGLFVAFFVVVGAVAIVVAVVRWDTAGAPAAFVLMGVVAGVALTLLSWWIWRGGYTASQWLAAPLWILPIVATCIAVAPDAFPGEVGLASYGFVAAYVFGFIPLAIRGNRLRRELGPDRAAEDAAGAWRWMHGGPR